MLIYSIGANFIPSSNFIQLIQLQMNLNLLSEQKSLATRLTLFFENSKLLNCGISASYRCAASAILNSKIDIKFDFLSHQPIQVILQNLNTDELPAASFSDNVQRFSDYLDKTNDLNSFKTTDTIGFILVNENIKFIYSSTGMGSQGRLPLTIVPGIGTCDNFGICGISTGYGEFLSENSILKVWEDFHENNLQNFYSLETITHEVIFETIPNLVTFTSLNLRRINEHMNYIYINNNQVYGIISMHQLLIIVLQNNYGIYKVCNSFIATFQ